MSGDKPVFGQPPPEKSKEAPVKPPPQPRVQTWEEIEWLKKLRQQEYERRNTSN